MNIFGEALAERGRWYIVIPPILLIAFLAGLFLLASAGQIRLDKANERVRVSQARQQALADYLALIRDAEASQRGYLLTGDPQYLVPYRTSAPKLESALSHLRDSYADDAASLARIRDLRQLTGRKSGELEATLALYEAHGATRAIQLVRTDFGEQVMDDIRQICDSLRNDEVKELDAATSGWRTDLRATRWLTTGGAALDILLVFIASRLVYQDLRRRALQARELRGEKADLERLVNERTRELATLSTHLQSVAEREKYALARELHDELGGLLVASRMDLSWVEQHAPAMEGDVKQRIKRIHEYLSAGVDLKRRVVEELRPTLLDSMGLFAAMRWQFKESCGRAGLRCTEIYPPEEPAFTPEASIAVFRILQESLTNILKHAQAQAVEVLVNIDAAAFTLRVSDDGKGISPDRLRAIGSHGLASMRHRVLALGGRFELDCPVGRGTVLMVSIPIERALAGEAVAAT